jgi:hypothetical protein
MRTRAPLPSIIRPFQSRVKNYAFLGVAGFLGAAFLAAGAFAVGF